MVRSPSAGSPTAPGGCGSRRPTDRLPRHCAAQAEHYRRSVWADVDTYVEVWLEKEALAGVLYAETDPYDVPLMVTRGYPSLSYVYEAAEAISNIAKPTTIYYFGDHDPSGVDIARNVEARLREFAPSAEIDFHRVAVTVLQIDLWQLPTRPTKQSEFAGSAGFTGESVEVDAIPPATLRGLCRSAIEDHIDVHALDVLKIAEDSEREILTRIADSMVAA